MYLLAGAYGFSKGLLASRNIIMKQARPFLTVDIANVLG